MFYYIFIQIVYYAERYYNNIKLMICKIGRYMVLSIYFIFYTCKMYLFFYTFR